MSASLWLAGLLLLAQGPELSDEASIAAQLSRGAEQLEADEILALVDALDELRLEDAAAAGQLDHQLRAVFTDLGWQDWGTLFDSRSASMLLELGRPAAADALLEAGRLDLGDEIARGAFYWAQRADLARLERDWSASLSMLGSAEAALAEAPLEPRPLWLEARALTCGVRAQVELFLGRLRPAWAALDAERAACEALLQHADTWGAERVRSVAGISAFRRAEFLLFSGRHAEVRALVASELAAGGLEPGLAVRLELLAALAEAEDELWKPPLESAASARLEQLFVTLKSDAQLGCRTALTLVRLTLARGELARAQAWLAAARPLAHFERERATLAALEGRTALRSGAKDVELRATLERLEVELHGLIESWRELPALAGGVGLMHDAARRELFADAIELAFAIGQPERGLALLLEAGTQGGLARSIAARTPDLAELQSGLLADAGALVYLPTFTRTHLLVVDKKGIERSLLPGGLDLGEATRALETTAPGPERETRLAALGAALLPSAVRKQLATWPTTYVVGAELLDYPPFAELPFAGSTLGTEQALAFLPSLTVGAALERRWATPSSTHTTTLLAATRPSAEAMAQFPELVSLELSDDELDVALATLAKFPHTRVTLASGAKVDRPRLLAALGHADLLELICHGVFAPSRSPLPAGFALATRGNDSGLFFGDELTQLERAPAAVVLAVCGAARGPTRHGEDGSGHLGGALLTAGTNVAILARGDLEVAGTLAILTHFNAALATGASPAEALRQAQAEAGPSPLFVFGLAHHPLLAPTPEQPGHTGSVALLVLLGAGAWLIARHRFSNRRP